MMSSVNKVILVGRLGVDPELRYTSNNRPVANFRIATSERWTDKGTGEAREATEWHSIVAWGKLGELAQQYLSKGRQVYIEGKLQTNKWQDKDGNDRYRTEVRASDIVFLDKAKMQENQGSENQYDYGPPPMDDDVPF